MVDAASVRFRDALVLDLAAHTGDLTAPIAALAREVVAVERNPACVRLLRERFAGSNVTIRESDVHRALWDLEPGAFDVVFCAGFLYHSAHPFMVLEGIARLRPRTVLIDTLNDDVPPLSLSIVEERELNRYNYRYSEEPDCGLSLVLGSGMVDGVMARLGYGVAERVEKEDLEIPAEKDSDYFHRWKQSLSCWYDLEEEGVEGDADA